MGTDLTIHRVPFVHLYRDLSFEDFFHRYDPWRDGKVWAATYSFAHQDFGFWAKLRPNSTLFVDKKYEEVAGEFIRRYPWFEVRSVPRLHSKVILFEQSGVLLVGSENLYAPSSVFSEVMIETFVPEPDRERTRQLLFGDLHGRLLSCKYGVKDIRLHRRGVQEEGTPFLPCNVEVDHWDLIANRVTFRGKGVEYPDPEFHVPNRVYHICEYRVGAKSHYLAFDRGYAYCGDLDQEAFTWLVNHCQIIEFREDVDAGNCPSYHFIQKDQLAVRGYWLGPVRNHEKFENLKVSVERIDITRMKVRRSQ